MSDELRDVGDELCCLWQEEEAAPDGVSAAADVIL